MRKIITLLGFILLLAGILIWNGWTLYSIGWLLTGFVFVVIGVIIAIGGVIATPSKELVEPFKSISENFDEMNKPLLIASIFVFLAAGWLLLIGAYELLSYHVSECLINYISFSNNCTGIVIHSYNETIRMFSVMAIIGGVAYVAAGVNILQKKHPDFILASLVFGSIVSILLGYYQGRIVDMSASEGAISFGNSAYVALRIAFPTAVLSSLSFFLVVWQYKEKQ